MIRRVRAAAGCLAFCASLVSCGSAPPPPPAAGGASGPAVYVGYVSDSDCGPDHAPMLATGKMGTTDRECVLLCVRGGAAFGFVDAPRRNFYQFDDQQKPRPFAGMRVRVTGRLEGDTLYVTAIEAAE